MKTHTQAEALFRILRRKRMTYLQMLLTGISTCPHKRLEEEKHKLAPREQLVRGIDRHGRVTFRVVRAGEVERWDSFLVTE